MPRRGSRTRRGLVIPPGMILAPGRGTPTQLWRPGLGGSGMALRPRPPVGLYRGRARTVLTGGTGQAKVSAATARVQLGPQGLGTVWYPQAAAIATTSGAADSSTCTIYVGTQAILSQIAGQSYLGGGDSIGLASPPLTPGQFLIAVWTTAVNNDTASLVIYGEQEVLT
jgi:hypothetical protein